MYLFIAGFFANMWIHYGAIIFSCIIWGGMGASLISPLFFAEALYNSHKTVGRYHFRQANHLLYRQYQRETIIFGLLSLPGLTTLLYLAVY